MLARIIIGRSANRGLLMKYLVERLLAGVQYILPQRLLTRLVYSLMRTETKWVKNLLIRTISRLAGINYAEALSPDPADYCSFNAWFTRELKPAARNFDLDPLTCISPSDGRISATGRLHDGRILQAKARDYSVQDLLANDPVCAQLENGYFCTIYLSPKDYHRVHMPLTGKLQRMIHVPGRLFSVAPYTTRQIPRLFARNERVISVFATDSGPMVQVLVGALLVASIETVWAGEITPTKSNSVSITHYTEEDITLAKGAEMGRFNMGSTVILLLPSGLIDEPADLHPGDEIKVGQPLATLRFAHQPH